MLTQNINIKKKKKFPHFPSYSATRLSFPNFRNFIFRWKFLRIHAPKLTFFSISQTQFLLYNPNYFSNFKYLKARSHLSIFITLSHHPKEPNPPNPSSCAFAFSTGRSFSRQWLLLQKTSIYRSSPLGMVLKSCIWNRSGSFVSGNNHGLWRITFVWKKLFV